MRAGHSKLFVVTILLGLALCVSTGIVVIKQYQKLTDCYDDRPPLSSMNLTIDTTDSQQLIEQLQKFANKHGFDFEVSTFSPTGDKFSVWMHREDVDIVVRSPFDPGEFKISLYNNNCAHPILPSDIGGLATELESFIKEIPGVILTEED